MKNVGGKFGVTVMNENGGICIGNHFLEEEEGYIRLHLGEW